MKLKDLASLIPSPLTLWLRRWFFWLPLMRKPPPMYLKINDFIRTEKLKGTRTDQFDPNSLLNLLEILRSGDHKELALEIISLLDRDQLKQISQDELFATIVQQNSHTQDLGFFKYLLDRLGGENLLNDAFANYVVNHLSKLPLAEFSGQVKGASVRALLAQLGEQADLHSLGGVNDRGFECFFKILTSLPAVPFWPEGNKNSSHAKFTRELYFSLFPHPEQRKGVFQKWFNRFLQQNSRSPYDQITFLNQVYSSPPSGIRDLDLTAELTPLIRPFLNELSLEEFRTFISALRLVTEQRRQSSNQTLAVNTFLNELLRERAAHLSLEEYKQVFQRPKIESSPTKNLSERASPKSEMPHEETTQSADAPSATHQKSSLFADTASTQESQPAAESGDEEPSAGKTPRP